MRTRPTAAILTACVLAILLTSCKSGNQSNTTQQAQPAQPNQPADQAAGNPPSAGAAGGEAPGNPPGPGAPSGAVATAGAPAGQSAPPEPRPETVTVHSGKALTVRLASGISTGTATEGSEFEGTLAAPLVVNGVEVAPTGSRVRGEVARAVSSGRLNRPAELSLVLTSLTPRGGRPVQISTTAWSAQGQSHKKRDAELIGGGAGVGALIGALAGRGKGAAIGGLVGAGAGTAGAAATGKKEIVLAPETKLTFRLTAPVTLEVGR